MMRHIVEYSAWAGFGWLASNALFIIVWCWFHSQQRPWMHDSSQVTNVFKVHNYDANAEESAWPSTTEEAIAMLVKNEMSMNKAS
jgi:hypothetical protein